MTKLPPTMPTPYTTQTIALDRISANPANARKHFDDDELKALAASIAVQGLLQAPAVRPARAGGVAMPGVFILIWGERRTKAAKLAGLKEIEVRIYDVDEVKAAELSIVENDQRVDLTPLERAAGYQELHKKHGLSYDAIADQVKKSRSSVYQAVALLSLSAEPRRMLVEGEISVTIAGMISELPVEAHEGALEFALEGDNGDPVSSRVFKDWVKEEFMLDLADAPFDVKDAALVPAAGACINCRKRTGFGGQADLFAEGGRKSADLCKDKPCFDNKVKAKKSQALAKAEQDGLPLLSAGESKKALRLGDDSEYVRVDQWSKELAKTKLEPVIAVAPDGALVEVARKKDVKAALKEAGSKLASSPALSVEKAPTPADNKADREKAELEEVLVKKVEAAAKRLIVSHVEKKGLDGPFLRALARSLMSGWHGADTYMARGLKSVYDEKSAQFDKNFSNARPTVYAGLLVETCIGNSSTDYARNGSHSPLLLATAKLAGVDLAKLEKELRAAEELKADAERMVDMFGKCGVVDGKSAFAIAHPCFHAKGHAGVHSNGNRTWTNTESKAKPVVEKVPTKMLAAAAKKAPKAKAKKKAGKR